MECGGSPPLWGGWAVPANSKKTLTEAPTTLKGSDSLAQGNAPGFTPTLSVSPEGA